MNDIKYDPFDEYVKNLSPTKKELGYAWSTAIGLQDVDHLSTSEYLYETAKKNIDGEISIEEADNLIHTYYESKKDRDDIETRTEEADKVSARIAKILADRSFTMSSLQYLSIHQELFKGIYSHAGKIRDYNITKKEWVLNGDTVLYGSAYNLKETLEYDINLEKSFKFKGLSIDETITHLASFVANLWQIHVFGEGNTRTTAVFFIKYLRTLGFNVENDMFAQHSWYFRNALVRANYNNIKENVYETTEYLEKFLRNLLINESNELHNRELHVHWQPETDQRNIIRDLEFNTFTLTEREKQIIISLKENPGMNRLGLAEELQCSDSTVKRTLQSLVSKGVIKRIGSNRNGEWIVI